MVGLRMDQQAVAYYLDQDHRFIVENYNWSKPFSNFFPGIGGEWGIPMWIYYVNRAQCISSIGVRDKDHAILEFYSFNKALQLIAQQGFRTFLKIDGHLLYEPFQKNREKSIRQKMILSSEELEINDVNPKLGIETSVLYFALVNEPTPSLVRELRVKNLKTRPVKLEILDGLPRILPHGLNQNLVKFTARHIEAMMGIKQLDGVPLFRLKQTPADVPKIGRISGGNFCMSFLGEGGDILQEHFIVDPYVIFGEGEAYDYPWLFERYPLEKLLSMRQLRENKTPCAFTASAVRLPTGGEVVLYSMVGNTASQGELRSLLGSVKKRNFFRRKRDENWEIIETLKHQAFTVSSSREFDQYCQQTFLDNVLRGGMPLVFDTAEEKSALYLYSRKHGDLERDYNFFILDPAFLSQGDGFYRDVNQNRRSDVWFFPEVEDSNIVTFLNLLQTDGYNPQVISRITYTAKDTGGLRKWLKGLVKDEKLHHELLGVVGRPFTPGKFIMKLEEGMGRNPKKYEKVLRELLFFCRQNDVGDLHEGFWVDHWTYNIDLIERFLEIYPERLKEILVNRKVYTFYDNADVVLLRDRKYMLVDGKVRQYGAVVRDQEKVNVVKGRSEYPTRVRTRHGHGRIYKTSLLVKLLSIVANKMATLDPQGIGVMMEADKPGWCDPLNGLPGLLGSSICETIELERLTQFLRKSLDEIKLKDDEPVPLYEELYAFVNALGKAIEKRLDSKGEEKVLAYWEESNQLKERYRERTKMGIGGLEWKMTIAEVKVFLDKCLKLLSGVFNPENREKIFHESGVCYTYFINEVVSYESIWKDRKRKIPMLSHTGLPLVKAKRFHSRPMALFLEGPVHLLRAHPEWKEKIYRGVKRSRLYDRKIKMYRSCESLEKEPFEIGRIRAYTYGWVEHGSIYLHMEYKWLLELLRNGLYREFYRGIKTILIPFLCPDVYGRSILEGSSFIVSSAFGDDKLHGRGFQPRLSGNTCELLHLWTLMVAGEKPFFLDERGRLMLRLRPILPGWLFTREKRTYRYYNREGRSRNVVIPENAFAFKFIGKSLVVYHNQERKDTFGEGLAKVVSYRLKYHDGRAKTAPGDVMETSLALDVRQGRVERIDVILT
ncbi:MAG: hypothetical protein ACE5JQ_01780 [Candidatus Methylomirabilales bacterium]